MESSYFLRIYDEINEDNYIPFKAYVIVAALTGLVVAMILTKVIKR